MVMYWYQSRDRVVAQEYAAKFWVVADAIRYNRTDTALVRIIVPINRGEGPPTQQDMDNAESNAVDLIQATYPTLLDYLPS